MATETTDIAKPGSEPRAQRSNILAAARRLREKGGEATIAMDALASEAGVTPEILSGHFQSPQEVLLALSADDLAAMAQIMRPQGAGEEAAPPVSRPGALLKRKGPITDSLDQVMKELVPDSNAGGSGTPQARLERRIQMLEKAFAEIGERNEKSLRERGDAMAGLNETIVELRSLIEASNRKHAETVAELKKALMNAHIRLNGLEFATLGAPAPATSVVPEYPPANENLALDAGQSHFEFIGPPMEAKAEAAAKPKPSQTVAYLASARRAANDALAMEETAAPETQAKPPAWKRIRFLLFGFLAPMTIVATALFVLNRHNVTAETVHKPVAEVSQLSAPPELVALQPEDPSPAQLAGSGPLPRLLDAANTGDPAAQRDAGLKYLAGDGVARDDAEAARWLLRAAYQGEAEAEYRLGTLYARGLGVPADAGQANHWYEKAALQGNKNAMHALGVAHLQGAGTEQNSAEAARWFTQAAEAGLPSSAFNLAVLFERGAGVTQSLSDAYKWYAIAALQGQADAEARMAVLEPRLHPADLAQAQQKAGDFTIKAPAASVGTRMKDASGSSGG